MSKMPGIKLNTTLKQDSPNLDILRATAILVVLVSHFPSSMGLGDDPFWGLESIGRMGVRMFFIHTSLVLMLSLQRLELQGGTGDSRRRIPYLVHRQSDI
jgi:peptidoglycan/LPS O-acetylase OafA/YrhL